MLIVVVVGSDVDCHGGVIMRWFGSVVRVIVGLVGVVSVLIVKAIIEIVVVALTYKQLQDQETTQEIESRNQLQKK